MSFLDAFTPEGMLRAMGVKPQEMLAEYNRWQAEFVAMKEGVRQATAHFDAQCRDIRENQARIMMNQTRIMAMLDGLCNGGETFRIATVSEITEITTEVKPNGHE
jgi:hypothetical protein